MDYLTFPIILLRGKPSEIQDNLAMVKRYCFYDLYLKEYGECLGDLDYVSDKLGIRFADEQDAFETGKMCYESIPECSPKTSIRKKMILEFERQQKTEFEIVCFLAYAAFRSIIQKQAYTKATNKYLLSRMSGNCRQNDKPLEWLQKYSKEYQLNKIKKELELKFGLKYYSFHIRGFYVSFSMDLKALIAVAERKRKLYQVKLLAQKKTELRAEVLKELNEKNTIHEL